MIRASDIQNGRFQPPDLRQQVRIKQGDLPDPLLALKPHQAFQEADEDIFCVLASENFFEGKVYAGINEFHGTPP